MRICQSLFCSFVLVGSLFAQSSMTLAVDATEAPRKLLHVRETIPTRAGALTLIYPEWIPGEHGPTGPVVDVAGLHIAAGGKEIAWKRDLIDMYAVHITVPANAKEIELTYDFLLPAQASGFSAGASSSSSLLVLS